FFMVRLWFDKGTILLSGDVGTPYGRWDPRVGCYRIKAAHYRDVLDYLKESEVEYRDEVPSLPPLESLRCTVELRPYQKEALKRWRRARMRGVLVLPTAAGKTYIALKAVGLLKVQTLIVVPTLDLIDQWRARVKECLNVESGAVGGGESAVRMVTVSTYDSAYLQAEWLGNRFMFIVFDEVHHLASPSYMQIAELYIAPYRMGLTATYERSDERHKLLPGLVGDLIYEVNVDELAGKHLSPYTYEKVFAELDPDEQRFYEDEMNVFRGYLKEKGITLRSAEDFQRFIIFTGRDRRAREALLARNRALKTALNSRAKLNLLAEQLESCRGEKVLIFTLHNDLVYTISRRFLIPALTYQTPKEERRRILEGFRSGEYKAIVTSQVLDEGVDVPDASVGFILSGTGSTREYIQRLGRLLRKVEGKEARLVEIVSKETVEVGISRRRRQKTSKVRSKV
ncbi:MAG: DEAD/DEAH box helicase family protein, partial [Candidatus Bathycorpusculaceae bacterium]